MREAIGGTMLFWLVLFFMSIFIAFLACVIQYSKVYKIKNSTLSYIERAEGLKSREEFENLLLANGYNPDYNRYVVCRYHPNSGINGGYYYIKLYASFSLPLVPEPFRIGIKGETRIVNTGVLVDSTDSSNSWFTENSETGQCFDNFNNNQSTRFS